MKDILRNTAIDVSDGYSNPSSSGAAARAGPDLATGYGLVDVEKAIAAVSKSPSKAPKDACCEPCASQSNFQSEAKSLPSLPTRSTTMSSEFPRLQKHLEEIRIKIDEMLKNDFIDKNLIEEVELELKPEFFISRSYQADAVIKLREILIKLPKISSSNTRKIDSEKIQKQHIYAAQSLLQMSRCEKLAIEVLIA
jgi:hypothetical protein